MEKNGDRFRNGHFLRFLWLSILAICMIGPNLASAATYYLDAVNGSDNNPGSEATPWKTMVKVASSSSAGDTIMIVLFNDGTFSANWPVGQIYRACGVTQWGITWTFDTYYRVGKFCNGDFWVVGPVTITGITPRSTAVDTGNPVWVPNGAMIDPDPTNTSQGYDSTMLLNTYNAHLNVALDVDAGNPLVLSAGSSLISYHSRGTRGDKLGTGDYPQGLTAAVLTALATAPPANSFRPGYCGSGKVPAYTAADINYNLLAKLTTVPGQPTLHADTYADPTNQTETVERMFERVWLEHRASYGSRGMRPLYNQTDYGADLANQVGIGAMMLQLDLPDETKAKLAISYIQLGIDLYSIVAAGGINLWKADGGHNAGMKMPIIMAGVLLNDSNMKAIGEKSGDYLYSGEYGAGNAPPDYIYFQEDDQTFYVEAADVYSQPYKLGYAAGPSTTGTIKVTNGSNIIEGVGTNWTNWNGGTSLRFIAVEGQGDDQAYKKGGAAYWIMGTQVSNNGKNYYCIAQHNSGTGHYSEPGSGSIWETYWHEGGDGIHGAWAKDTTYCPYVVPDDTHMYVSRAYTGTTNITGNMTYYHHTSLYYGHGSGAGFFDWEEFDNADIGKPRWGVTHASIPLRDGHWDPGYMRLNLQGWAGHLAMIIMEDAAGTKTLWNHDALFDLIDYWMETMHPTNGEAGRQSNVFVENMWDKYRSNYGDVWGADPGNSPPVLGSIGDKSISGNNSLSFTVSATDADNDSITYSSAGLPSGATFANLNFSWTPYYTQAGTYQVTFTASDGEASDSEQITITVNNDSTGPVISNTQASNITTSQAAVTWTTNETSTSQVEYGLNTAYGSITSLDSSLVASHSVVLSGLTSATAYHYRVRSKDASGNETIGADYTFTTVSSAPANQPPVANTGSVAANEDINATVTLTGSDPDAGDSVESYQIISLPSHGTLKLSGSPVAVNGTVTQAQINSGSVTFTPEANWYGSTQFNFKAGDGQLWSANTALLTINVAAKNDTPTIEWLANQSADVGTTINLTVKANDIDNNTISLSGSPLPAGATFTTTSSVAGHAEGLFSWTPTQAQAGSNYTVTFLADDGQLQAPASVTITVNHNNHILTLSAQNGTINKTPDQTSYIHNSSVTLTAVPQTGYHFLNFSGDLSSTANPSTVTMSSNKTIAANFVPNTYTLTVPGANCTVIKTPNQALYSHGTSVTLTVVPNPGYNFVGFSGDASGSTNPITIIMDTNKSITPNCQIGTYTLATSGSNGIITKVPDQASYTYNSMVTLTAQPNDGYHFVNFSGDLTGSTSPGTITINSNKNVGANFAINTYTLNLVSPNCTVTKTPDKSTYNHGEAVTLTATAAGGYNFVGWSGNFTGSVNPAVITMNGNKSITANCQINTYSLTVNATGGAVNKSPDQAGFAPGSTVTLTAVPQEGYHFVSFSGDLNSTTNPATVTIDTNKTIIANFAINSYSLNVAAANCQVTASPGQSTYNHGQTITLTAVPNAGYNFVGWSGSLTASANPVTFTINQNKTITANCQANTYSLTVTAANGTVSKSPDQASYNHNSTVTLTAVPNNGYHFTGWSGNATGSANPVTVTMNAAKTVTANFSQDIAENQTPVLSPIGNHQVSESNTLSFKVTATDADVGDIISYSVTKLPQGATFTTAGFFTWQPTYEQTGTYELTFAASDGTTQDNETIVITVHDVNRPPVFIEINDMTVQANIPITFTVQASDPDNDLLTFSVESLPQGAVFSAQTHTFTWTPQNSTAADYSITFIVSDGEFTDYQTITISVQVPVVKTKDDVSPPTVTQCSPKSNTIQAPVNGLIILDVTDTGDGIDPASLVMTVENNIVYQDDLAKCVTEQGQCRRAGTDSGYTLTFQSDGIYNYDKVIQVTVDAKDKAGNTMPTYNYHFTTEMLGFTAQQALCAQNPLAQSNPTTILDNNGNTWAACETGIAPEKSICVSKMAAGENNFQEIVTFANAATDMCAPVLDIDNQGKIYLAWQDNRRGTWDIYVTFTSNGLTWSGPARVTDSQADHQQPALAIDNNTPANVYIAWVDNGTGNNDIYIATSKDGFITKTTTAITTNTANQTSPALAACADNKIYAVWSDARNANLDIYGASLSNGAWTTRPIIQNSGDQSLPALAAGPGGSSLYLAWQDNSLGNNDIFYTALPDGLPVAALTGRNIIDDNVASDQSCPAIATTQENGNVKVFISWQDRRNVNKNNDSDIYLAEVLCGAGTNVLVTDDSANAPQSTPAMGIAADGQPYLLWVDSLNASSDIYYSRTATIAGQTVAQQEITASNGGIVGTAPDDIDDVSDISVQVPAGAFWSDVNLTITRIDNPPSASSSLLDVASYEFGPSSEREFALPVVITLPYAVADASADRSVYWYNPQIGALSQSGISNVEDIVISSTLRAIRFRTTHFSQYITGTQPPADPKKPVSGGAGGCCLSRYNHSHTPGNITGYFLPYLAFVMLILALKRRDSIHATHRFRGP